MGSEENCDVFVQTKLYNTIPLASWYYGDDILDYHYLTS